MPHTCTSHSPCSLCCNVMLLYLGWLFSWKHFLHSWSNNPPLWFKCSGGCLSVGSDQQLDLRKWFYFCHECMHDFIMHHDKYCICAFLACFVTALCHSSEIFSKCSLRYLGCCWIMHQLFVAWDCLSSDKVDHGIWVVLEIQWKSCTLHAHMWCVDCAEWCLFM